MYDVETAMEYIEMTQEKIEGLLHPVEDLAEEALMARDWAMGNGTWTAAMETTLLEGYWNMEYVVAEGSGGVHNPPYAEALLRKATEQFEMVIMDTDMGGVMGKVAYNDSEPIEGATIKDGSGATVATTNATGEYFFWAMSGAVNYPVYFNGSVVGTVMGTAVMHTNSTFDQVTVMKEAPPVTPPPTNGDGEEDDEGMFNTLSYALIGIIILLVIVMVVMMMKK
jgi:hypothetical protein